MTDRLKDEAARLAGELDKLPFMRDVANCLRRCSEKFEEMEKERSGEQLTRYCPECGSVGEVQKGYRDCCPDGSAARMIPLSIAEKAKKNDELLQGAMIVLAQLAPAPVQEETNERKIPGRSSIDYDYTEFAEK